MELVSHPNHYNLPGRKECIVEMEEKYGAEVTAVFCLTNSYKYLYRAGAKDGNTAEQDIDKAKFYFNYVNKLLAKYEELGFNGIDIDTSGLYLDIEDMIMNYGE